MHKWKGGTEGGERGRKGESDKENLPVVALALWSERKFCSENSLLWLSEGAMVSIHTTYVDKKTPPSAMLS